MQGKIAERDCVFRIQEKQTLDTKTRYAFIGTWNQFCTAGMYKACLKALPKHEEHMIKNEGKLKKYMNQDFPSFMIRRSNVRLPDMKDVSMEETAYLEYYYHLWYSLVVEVADSDWDRFCQVMESYDAAAGFKRTISENCHLLDLVQGKLTDVARIEWCKKMRAHMNFNHK